MRVSDFRKKEDRMFKRKTIINSINEETDARYYLSKPYFMLCREWVCKKWKIVSLSFAIVLYFVISAEAGMVYGHLYGAEGYFQPSDTFTLTEEKGNRFSVTTDENKGYSINIPPGIYKVEFKKGGNVWEAWIQSLPDAVGQDIYLQKVR
jgi:hypothetical protein